MLQLREAVCLDFDRLVYPRAGEAPPRTLTLSEDIRRDYDEASSILDRSPRGAAALIRLAIQKLCKELGQVRKRPERGHWGARYGRTWTPEFKRRSTSFVLSETKLFIRADSICVMIAPLPRDYSRSLT